MASLYELTNEMQVIESELQESGGEMSEALVSYLDELGVRIDSKVENYCFVIRNNESMSNSIGEEIKRMQARKKSHDRTVARLKQSLRDAMIRIDVDRVQSERFTVSTGKAGGVARLEVDDIDALPPEYVKTTVAPDNAAIRNAIAAGVEIYGVRLADKETVLRIK